MQSSKLSLVGFLVFCGLGLLSCGDEKVKNAISQTALGVEVIALENSLDEVLLSLGETDSEVSLCGTLESRLSLQNNITPEQALRSFYAYIFHSLSMSKNFQNFGQNFVQNLKNGDASCESKFSALGAAYRDVLKSTKRVLGVVKQRLTLNKELPASCTETKDSSAVLIVTCMANGGSVTWKIANAEAGKVQITTEARMTDMQKFAEHTLQNSVQGIAQTLSGDMTMKIVATLSPSEKQVDASKELTANFSAGANATFTLTQNLQATAKGGDTPSTQEQGSIEMNIKNGEMSTLSVKQEGNFNLSKTSENTWRVQWQGTRKIKVLQNAEMTKNASVQFDVTSGCFVQNVTATEN